MEETTTTPQKKKGFVKKIIIVFVLLTVAFFGVKKIQYALQNEDTENSQIECNISPITTRIAGYVTALNVKENLYIKAGDTLLRIDDRDLQIKVKQAEIALQNAKANLEVVRANVHTANASSQVSTSNIGTSEANIESAKIRVWKATEDFKRYENLLASKSVTQQQFEGIQAEKELAEKLLQIAEKQKDVSQVQTAVTSAQEGSAAKQISLAQLSIEQKQSELDFAKLQWSYATVVSPINGYVSRKNVQLGQLVSVGQNLFSIVDESSLWITANFKETQLEKMQVGQKVNIKVDAYPNDIFEGEIESFSAATGSKFSLLPPDNSSGNFVKIVQRIPVRISIKNTNKSKELRAGMNVKVVVRVS